MRIHGNRDSQRATEANGVLSHLRSGDKKIGGTEGEHEAGQQFRLRQELRIEEHV